MASAEEYPFSMEDPLQNVKPQIVFLSLIAFFNQATFASSNVPGKMFQFTSPNGVVETCTITNHIPGGSYSDKDQEEEEKFCSLNMYGNDVALCGKTWSTSAATVINALSSNMSQADAEARMCAMGKNNPLKAIVKFKQTVSFSSGASGLFSLSSLVYYHLSRYLDTTVDVPVAVVRTMDRNTYLNRVALPVRPTAAMNIKAWEYMRRVVANPAGVTPDEAADLFTPDLGQLYGVMAKDKGKRYGAEINSGRLTSGYTPQNQELQDTTPTFLALRSSGNLVQAIQNGVAGAFNYSAVKAAFGGGSPSATQMTLWMNEMSEMAVLDYIMSQQDRVGNIDYRWYFVYADAEGNVHREKVESEFPLTKKGNFLANVAKTYAANDTSDLAEDSRSYALIKQFNPELVQKTMIGDNDAGGRNYSNFTKSTQFIEKFQHFNAELYKKVLQLDADFKSNGPALQYLQQNLGLKSREAALIAKNTGEVASILKGKCKAGTIRFDLVSYKKAFKNEFTEEQLNCDNP